MVLARENPFRVERVLAVRYRFPEGDPGWDGLFLRLEALRGRGAIVGPEGHGKTTLLEDLAVQLEARGYRVILERVTRDRPRVSLPRISSTDFVLIDGADLLPRGRWLRALWNTRGTAGLVVTAHRAGLLPTLHLAQTSPGLFSGIVATLDGSAGPAEDLFRRHGGNVRTALRELYDFAARGVRRNGCASVLNTTESKSSVVSGANSR